MSFTSFPNYAFPNFGIVPQSGVPYPNFVPILSNIRPPNYQNFPFNFLHAGPMHPNIVSAGNYQMGPMHRPPPINYHDCQSVQRIRNNSVVQDSSPGTNYNSTYEAGYEWQAPPNVLLYIDNSNVFESAKKYSSLKKGYRNGIPDVACRIDIAKLISKAVGRRGLVFGKLYGSEPPALDKVWEAMRRKAVHVELFQRSKWTLKEKETDSSLTADAVEDIIMEKDKSDDLRTVILFSGDRDLLRVVDKAIKHGYRVEIWAFKSSISNTIKQRAKEMPDKVFVNSIDDIFEEISYSRVVWGKKTIPRERSLVASVKLPANCDKKKTLTNFVAKAGEIFKLPMMGKYMDSYKYILLVPCLKEFYTPQPCPTKSKSEHATVRTYNFYKHIQPFMHNLQEHFQSFCADVEPWLKFLQSRNSQAPTCILSSTRFQKLQIDDDDDAENGEEIEDEDILSEDESEDFDCNDFFDARHEDVDDDFIPVVRKETKSRRLYSTMCSQKFWCAKGLDCSYKHTEQQKEFFKKQPDANRRRLYKIKPCCLKTCAYANKTYLCPFAHNLAESRCICCKEKGSGLHWMDKCPFNRHINQDK